MRTLIIVCLAVLALTCASGCGSSLDGTGTYSAGVAGSPSASGSSTAGPVDPTIAKHQAGAALKRYWSALSADDGDAACNQLTDYMQQYLRAITNTAACPAAARKAAKTIKINASKDVLAKLARAQFDYAKLQVNGDVVIFTSDAILLDGVRGSSNAGGTTQVMRQPDGAWKISKLA